MANVIIVLILVVAVVYGIYNYVHHLNHGGGCCGEHDAPARKVKAADTNKSHYLHRLVMGVDGMTCQNCQRHVENALNAMTDTLAEADGLDQGRRRRRRHPSCHPRCRLSAPTHDGERVNTLGMSCP